MRSRQDELAEGPLLLSAKQGRRKQWDLLKPFVINGQLQATEQVKAFRICACAFYAVWVEAGLQAANLCFSNAADS